MTSDPSSDRNQNELAKCLKRFSLTYEQHQMLHGAGVGFLASRVLSRRKWFTGALGVFAVCCISMAVYSWFTQAAFVFWLLLFVGSAAWCFRRDRMSCELRNAIDNFADSNSAGQVAGYSLADELRFGFSLDYDEFQAINAGDAELGARRIIERCEKNTRTAKKGVSVLALLGLGWAYFMSFNVPILLCAILFFGMLGIALLGGFAVAASDAATIRRVRNLQQKYNASASASK